MFLTDRKLDSRVQELKEYRYRNILPLQEFLVKEDLEKLVNPVAPTDYTDWAAIHTGETWSGRDKYLWMQKEIIIPQEWKGRRAVGVFDFGNTGAGNNSGFESMLYLNGTPYQGVDVNHKEVFFEEKEYGNKINLVFRLWSGLEGGGVPTPQEHKIARADLAWLDEKTDHLYYMGTMLVDTLKNLPDSSADKYQLRVALDQAFLLIDWSYPGSDEFYESVHKAYDLLDEALDSMDKKEQITVKCVGHTHIDVAWLWRLKHTREKASRSFSTVLRLMELYPEYIFLQTQPQIYNTIKEDFPEIYEGIKKKVAEGRWEAEGGMWVEADCNLTSGESLTRQILIGSKFLKDEFGKDVEYLWLPDVFGYSWALPQILKKAGIETFMTTKISWNQYNRMPHDTFWWKGIDGSEILTHFITTPDPWSEPGSWFYTYNGQLTPKTVKGTWEAYSEKELNKELLISYGYGDGGGGVNRDSLEQRRCIDRIPGLPNLKTSTAGEFFRNLHQTMEKAEKKVPVWDGELYLEYHRGTYTSHAHNKRMNRKMELLYRRAEWFTIMKAILSGNIGDAEQEKLTEGWKQILTEQFHDIIPGSSICEVYEDSKKNYVEIEKIAKEVEADFLAKASNNEGNCYTILNGSIWELDEVVMIPETTEGVYTDETGAVLKSQSNDFGTYVEVKNVPAMGNKKIFLQKAENQTEVIPFNVDGKNVETPYYKITFNSAGQITGLFDKVNEREVLPKGERANVLQMFEDKPLGNDAWDIDIFYQEKMREITELTKFEIVEKGILRLVIRMEYQYMKSRISQDLILYANNPRMDFKTFVDFHEQHQLLKAAFPVDIRSTYATYDVQYGNVRRPNHWNTSWDQARFESVAHRWVDLSEHNYGVSLLNDSKYGHDVKDNVLRITLIKSATHPDHLQDQGEHFFTYALLPHSGDFVEGNVVKEGYALNEPMTFIKGEMNLPFDSFITSDCSEIELDAVKKSEDSKYIVVRFHEYTGSKQKVNLTTGFPIKGWANADLRERPLEEFRKSNITLQVNAYEIVTLLIEI